jgi:hypothetical protein
VAVLRSKRRTIQMNPASPIRSRFRHLPISTFLECRTGITNDLQLFDEGWPLLRARCFYSIVRIRRFNMGFPYFESQMHEIPSSADNPGSGSHPRSGNPH